MNRQRIQTDNSADGKAKDTPSTLYDSALRNFRSGRLDAAEERCRKALSANPGHADCLHLLGLIFAATNRLDPAIESVVAAVKNNPANSEYFSNLGTLLQRRGQFDEAFKSYDLALKLKPDSVGVWIKLGDLLFHQKRFDESLFDLQPRDDARCGQCRCGEQERFAFAGIAPVRRGVCPVRPGADVGARAR
jgi:Tfp pilus assembly protein PilF